MTERRDRAVERRARPAPDKRDGDGGAVRDFLAKVAAMPHAHAGGRRGRLLFVMDATASRDASWDTACQIQGDMFAETSTLGGLDVQLAFYRGLSEFRATPWVSSSADLIPYMSRVRCLGGHTQLGRALRYARKATQETAINAVVFVGDCFEEDADAVCQIAGELGLLKVPVFVFHEGGEPVAGRVFRQIAELSSGAYCPFDSSSPQQLRELLAAVAVYAAGGRRALLDYGAGRSGPVLQLTHQIK